MPWCLLQEQAYSTKPATFEELEDGLRVVTSAIPLELLRRPAEAIP